ncbi:TPA: molecular chaperone [Serratia marcescens]
MNPRRITVALALTVTTLVGGALSPNACAGLSLGQTRVVYLQSSASQSVSLQNSGSEVYLVQAAVTDWESNTPSTAFSILPPLFRLEGNSTNALRVMRVGGDLPQDRESVFHFRVNAIPAGTAPRAEKEAGASVSVSLGMGIKLFYRPDDLPIKPTQAYGLVTFHRQGNTVLVKNPTPYYLTFAALSLGGVVVDLQKVPMMVAPFSQLTYPAGGSGNRAEWACITDYGGNSETQHATIQ